MEWNKIRNKLNEKLTGTETKSEEWPSNTYEALAVVQEEMGEVIRQLREITQGKGSQEKLASAMMETIIAGLRFLVNLEDNGQDQKDQTAGSAGMWDEQEMQEYESTNGYLDLPF